MRKLNPWLIPLLGLAVACAMFLFSMLPAAHAQEGDPPPTQVPEIVGGAPASAGEWPWQVALVQGGAVGPSFLDDQFCGGSLIHPQWVVTAAHCITDGSGNVVGVTTVDVIAGIYNLASPASGYQYRDIDQIIRHPSYNGTTADNDIALLHLASPVTIGGSGETATALVPLVPSGIGALTGTNSWVTGWGNINASSPTFPDQLYEVQVPIIANSVCNDSLHWSGMITGNMLCAGYDAGVSSSCQGDSGGPLVVSDGGQWKLAGIVSWGGVVCGAAYRPGVYTRVSQYGSWVNGVIGPTTLVSPSGSIGTNTPTYIWNAVNTMTYYYLWVNGPSGNVIKQWYTAAEAGCSSGTGTCSVTPATVLGSGTHTWWVQTWNPAGLGPWSAAMTFNTPVPVVPGAATPTSPTGAISDYSPTYQWNKVTDSTWYYLSVSGPSGYAFTKWYDSSLVCGLSTCSVAGATPGLAVGTFTWKVQTWNSAGTGPWSATLTFNTPTPVVPGAATPTSPSGSITTNNPTYQWNKVNESTWYYLSVSGPSSYTFTHWYDSSLVCGLSTCSVAGATPGLAGGTFTWKVQTWSSAGYGPWSADMSFSIPTPWPVQPTLVSPNTSLNDRTPTFTWNAVSSETGAPATWYYLSVDGPGGNVIAKWYTDSEVGCIGGTGTCSATATTLLPAAAYTWRVYGWNSAGGGPWSASMSFSIASLGGFNSQFNGSSTGWNAIGYWFFDSSLSSYSTGRSSGDGPYSYSLQYTPSTYANFDYSARLRRAGCVWCDNSLYVRGTPTPLSAYGYWNNGYQFTYANDGTFSVWKVVNGTWYLGQDYTYTPAIVINGWNVLRVVASGNNLYYYINGTLVWSGTDTSFASGYAGMGVDSLEDVVTPGDQFWVDWAVLDSYTESMPVITDTVSPEQQALNDAANATGSNKIHGGYNRP